MYHVPKQNEKIFSQNRGSSFKKDDKFNGNIGQDIDEYIGNYIYVCTDYELDKNKKFTISKIYFMGKPEDSIAKGI